MYYRLTIKSSSDKSKVGDSVINSKKPIDIGQTQSCAVQLPQSDELEPVVFATIQPMDQGWCIVRRTDSFDINVNGKRLAVAQKLKDKDEISFSEGNTILRFDVSADGEYDTASGLVYRKHKNTHLLLTTCIIAVLAVMVLAISLFAGINKDIRNSGLEQYADAICHITVDSVFLVHNTMDNGKVYQEVIDSAELPQPVVGTCFLTNNGLLVTARHCIEPWLADETWDGAELRANTPVDVRFAVEAETRNMEKQSNENYYVVKSHCIISRGLIDKSFYSTDFTTDNSRDKIMELGTAERPLYWRTIFPIAHRRNMELGDFAYIKAPAELRDTSESRNRKPTIAVATKEEIVKFANDKGSHEIAVMGYPVNDNDADDNAKTDYGYSQPLELDDDNAFKGCMQMSAPINRGNSGGPVIAIIGGKPKVIGIVSKADHKAEQQTFWAVPITEVTASFERKNKTK